MATRSSLSARDDDLVLDEDLFALGDDVSAGHAGSSLEGDWHGGEWGDKQSRPERRVPVVVVGGVPLRARDLVGWGAMAIGGLMVVVAYLALRDEIDVSIQIPYLLTGGIGGLLVAGIGMAVLITGQLRDLLQRIAVLEDEVRGSRSGGARGDEA